MSNIDQMIENVRLARLTFAKARKDLEAAGFIVGEEYTIDPETGKIANLTLFMSDGYSPEKAKAVFIEMQRSGLLRDNLCSFGVGSLLRKTLRENSGDVAFKLHDFGYRRS